MNGFSLLEVTTSLTLFLLLLLISAQSAHQSFHALREGKELKGDEECRQESLLSETVVICITQDTNKIHSISVLPTDAP